MATSLQRQLAALAAPASSLLQPERRRVSIIFSPEEAAKFDKETFYQIGLEGLNELISVCPDLFIPFQSGILFSEAAKNFERAVEEKERNSKVDEAIEKFLLTVSPYVMLRASLKCMEWLVYRFHIERFNIESIMQCVMPYYDTKHFVSIIQTLQFGSGRDNTTVNWQWLAPSIQSATALRKATLYGNIHNPFVIWLFETLKKLLEVHRSHHENLTTYLNFMVSTIVGIVTKFSRDFSVKRQYMEVKNKKTIVDVVLNQIYSLFEEILFEKKYDSFRYNREIFSIAYVIIAAIGVTAEENPEIGGILGSKIKRIFNLLIKNRNVALLEETYMLIDMLVHHIYFEWTFKQPKLFHTAMEDLSVVSQSWDVSKVVSRLFLANCGNGSLLTPNKIFEYLSEIQLNPETRSEILSKMYFTYKGMYKADNKRKRWPKLILQKFERIYPSEFDLACQNERKLAKDLAKLKDAKDFSLLVEHPDEAVRAGAVRKLIIRATKDNPKEKKKWKKNNFKPDQNPTAHVLIPRFADDSQQVVTILLKSKLKRLQKIFTTETLLKGCFTVLGKRLGVAIIRLAIKKICLIAAKWELDEALEKQVLTILIPYLFPRKAAGILTAKKIICSKYAPQNPILDKYKPMADKIKEVTPEEFCRHSYEVWLTLDESHQRSQLDTKNPVELTISFLLLNDVDELNNLLHAAAHLGIRSSGGGFPVAPENFSKCLTVAEKRGCISLELILSKILKLNLPGVTNQINVIKFVWSVSEKEKHRETCHIFLKEFLQKCYPQETNRQFWFWLTTLHKTASPENQLEDNNNQVTDDQQNQTVSEFYLIRSLQFFTSFIQDFGIPARVEASKVVGVRLPSKPKQDSQQQRQQQITPHKPLTRSQGRVKDSVLSQSPPRGVPTKKQAAHTHATAKSSGSGGVKDIVREGVSPTWCLLEVVFAECLQHLSHRVRSLSMKFLDVVKCVPNLSADWEVLIGKILIYENEITADANQAASLIGKIIVDSELTSVKDQIVKTILNEETDKGVFMGMVNICQHTGSLIYSELEPMITKLLEADRESKQLLALLNCFEATPQSIKIVPTLLEAKPTAKIILKQMMNGRLFKNAKLDFKKQLFGLMVDCAVNCKIPEIKIAIQRCIRKWDVDTTLISEEIKKCMGLERLAAASNSKQNGKGKEKSSASETDPILNGWKDRAEIILEFVQGIKKLTDTKKILPPLFRILKICISLEQQSSVEYLKQLTLTVLTMCCAEDAEEDQNVDSGVFHVDLVIDCLRCSRNPQTHHHALILLNYAAKRFHEQVLHGVMSLFTFMGNSILRQDDTYSTQLIQQTVTTIIPALTKAGKGSNPLFSRIVVSSGIFRVFASALQDIPVHRRLPVFTSLVETLDPSEVLWQVLIIIVDNALSRDRKKSHLMADLDLAVNLAWSFGPQMVIKGLSRTYEFFNTLPAATYKMSVSDEEFRHLKADQSPVEKAVLDYSRKDNYQDIQRVIYYTIDLIMKIATEFADPEKNIADKENLSYDQLLEKCLAFSKIVSGLSEDKIFKLITQKNMEVVEKINAVLEAEEFVNVIRVALKRNEISIKRKLLDMFNLRMSQKIEWFGDLNILLPMLHPLLEIAQADPVNDETVTLIQTAFVSMKLIAKHLAFSYPDEFVPVFQLALKQSSSHEKPLLCASALLCLGELFCLKSLLLPNLNDVTSAILRSFKISSKLHKFGTQLQQNGEAGDEAMEEESEDYARSTATAVSLKIKEGVSSITTAHLLCISTIACMNKMTEQLGPLMGSKFLRKALVLLLTIDAEQFIGDASVGGQRRKTFDQRLRVLLKSIATKIPVRNSLIPLKDAFRELIGKPRAVTAIMNVLKEGLQVIEKPNFLLILSPLCETFQEEFFAYRYNLGGSGGHENGVDKDEEDGHDHTNHKMEVERSLEQEKELMEVEDGIIECLISGAVLKMSEGAFRPYYHKLYEWAKDSDDKLITFYRFSAAAAEKLKSLFVTFAGYVMNDAVGCLNRNVNLTRGVLSLFYHLFSNDREGFVTTDRFNVLVKPLVDLMESTYILSDQIELKTLSDTLIQLAVASNDLNRWQYMLDLVSSKAHHTDKRVRLNVIYVLEAAATELGKDFLPLLPPVVPFVAELMNDDEADVEAATQKMLLKLESIVGEPLQPYFT